MTGYFLQAFVYLIAAVLAVPLAKKLGLGSVLGYLIAGVVIGPVIGLVGTETATIQHFAEFGVVMMLFVVGLELEPKMLWGMRHKLIGLGGLQVTLSTLVVMAISLSFGLQWSVSLAIGLIFSLSSTAIVLQTFNEKGLSKTDGGRSSFSVLLFQDIAVIPMLALIPLLALPELVEQAERLGEKAAEHGDSLNIAAHLPGWAYALVVIVAIATLVVGGHYLSRPLFRYVASSGLREIFTAATLMLVIGIAALMGLIGLSPALGAFLAGVVLANSEFRHELESTIEPFKGLLLGLFFITVGAGVDFGVLQQHWPKVIAMALAVMLIKAAVLFVLAIIFKIKNSDRWLFALSLAQAGEFGFVLLNYTVQNNVIPQDISQILSLVVAFSMFLTPSLFILYDKVILPRYARAENHQDPDEIDEKGTVIIAGIGRFGQIVNRFLVANGISTVVLDHQAGQVELMRKINIKSYFGDATQPELLHTAGIEEAKLMVVTIDDKERVREIVKYVKHAFPHVRLMVRAFDRGHAYELRSLGADHIITEAYYSALEMGGRALSELGVHPYKAEQLKTAFDQIEKDNKDKLYHTWLASSEDNRFNNDYRELFLQLEALLGKAMSKDRSDGHSLTERSWTPPPKNYQDDFKDKKT
ncbi:monovalent cation:proton antiporter-2 (CPA2) family protein [Agarivorans sp. MS3-6]|uniref:monovalent cation:proton antiporter-2 (CPA2) family protein n=1 Tax=Agarivorans sp. TSD2052 TaxID=2937286 RepID=UPI00200E86D6|nr:monovalent cation:proton antiporter-2 (CPA2) family protein [Agarivorans sp. TSD2052]UPW19717.1 monovalent cation:proton antiporter-2 (CPA2) family protein [Agarivorans sp. TSD2052]